MYSFTAKSEQLSGCIYLLGSAFKCMFTYFTTIYLTAQTSTFSGLKKLHRMFPVISHTMTFTWNNSFITARFIICRNNKLMFSMAGQSSGRALKSHSQYLNEFSKFEYRLRFVAVLVVFLAVSARVSPRIHFITAGHSALMITESIGRIAVVLSNGTNEI